MAANLKGLNGTTPPAMPFWWFIIQIVTCVLGLGMFIVACYCIHVLPGGGPQAFLLFDALMIWLFVGGFIAIQRFQPALYYRLVFIISHAILIVFVLSAWAWSASAAGAWLAYSGTWYYYDGGLKGLGAGLAVGAAIGAIVWVLLIVSLVFFVLASIRDGAEAGPDAEMGAVKTEQPAVADQQTYVPDQPQEYQQYPPQQQQQQQELYPPQQEQQYPPQQQQQYPPNQQGPYHS